MAKDRNGQEDFVRPIRRILVGLTAVFLIALFLLWRVDSPRVERFRTALVDRFVPSFSWLMLPVTRVTVMAEGFQSYARIYEQNQELRRELQQMKAWKEAALQLEQKNAKLLDLNQVRLDPSLTHVTGVVLADSGSPFRQSVLLNVGARDGIYKIVRALAERGIAILMISDEVPEAYFNSDRILHMANGRIVGEYDPRRVSIAELERAVYA